MENIEPWNMFTNEFVAEETDDLLTDDLVAEYAQKGKQVTQVKQEPTDRDDDDLNVRVKQEQSSDDLSQPDEESNDNELFNFGVEPEVDISIQHDLDDETSGSDQGSHRIDYDSAAIFICPACGLEFETNDNWKHHIDTVHKFSTRRGLNFVQVDKLYHQCLECKKKIAMHSMENILKHKFTHLPYKRIKCRICLKQYKYRHDLIVHLRMTHRDDLLSIAKAVNAEIEQKTDNGQINFEIKNVQENAIDIFENTIDGVDVKSEAMHEDEDQDEERDFDKPRVVPNASNFDESLSRSSSRLSDTSLHNRNAEGDQNEQFCEKYIQYICPQCGEEFGTQPQWEEHIEGVHNFGSRVGLNFKEVSAKQHAQCLQCSKVVYINDIRNLQRHKFSHLPHKSWVRCKLCFRTFVGHKEIVKHLMSQHRVGEENDAADSQEGRVEGDEDLEDYNADGNYLEQSREERSVDIFEIHIDYLCPQCGKDFIDKKLWRKHIVKVHHLTDMKVLNFKILNDRQVSCLECGKIITNAYGVQNAQQHKFTHLPYKSFVRCRLCFKSYTDRKGLVKHLKSRHRIGEDPEALQTSFSPLPTSSLHSHNPVQKEIVKHADYTFEIKYLDDDSHLLDDTPVPELTFSGGFDQFASFKCKQCSANFPSQAELQTHINDEHEFLDFNNLRPLPESPRSRSRFRSHLPSQMIIGSTTISKRNKAIERPNREVEGRIPTRHENLNSSDSNNAPVGNDAASPSSKEGGIERNFCYLCPNCGYECATQMLWRRHINDVHNYDKRPALNFRALDKFRYQCQQCMDIVSGSKLKGLQDHKFRHLPFRLYIKCLICGTCYNHKPNMMSHLRQKHNIVDNRSSTSFELSSDGAIVNLKSSTKPSSVTPIVTTPLVTQTKILQAKNVDDSLTYHNAVDHEYIRYFCPQCNEQFSTHVHWRKHIVEEHNLNNRQGLNFRQIDEHHFLCLQCYKRVTVTHTKGAIGQLQSHKFRHLPYKSFKCISCNSEFVRKQMFFKHLNKDTNTCFSKSVCVEATQDYQDERTIDSNSNHSAFDNSLEGCYILVCPQCGLQFDSKRPWRDHINAAHDLLRRDRLNFKKLTSSVYECMQCFEHLNGAKLRELQIHKFKHLPFGAYIQCRYCIASYHYMRNMYDHLKIKHRHILEKNNEVFEEISFPDDDNSIEPEEQYLLG